MLTFRKSAQQLKISHLFFSLVFLFLSRHEVFSLALLSGLSTPSYPFVMSLSAGWAPDKSNMHPFLELLCL